MVGTRQGMDQLSVMAPRTLLENGIVVSTITSPTSATTISMFKVIGFIEAVKALSGEGQEKRLHNQQGPR